MKTTREKETKGEFKKKAIITGDRGFVGNHLANELIDQGWEVYGFSFRDGHDIRDYETVRQYIDIVRPTAIFHLAAQAHVGESFSNPKRAFETNTLGSLNVLEAVRQLGLKTTVHMAGSSEEYGRGSNDEHSRLDPQSPYATSKAAATHLGVLYAKSYKMHVIITRAFNHTGPGRGEMYAESSFAKQIAEIEKGKRKILEHGNLESIRNYTDVRDIVKGYILATKASSGIYNLCSEENRTMFQVLNYLISLSTAGITKRGLPSLIRPLDFSFSKPSCKRFNELTGWKPTISFETSMQDLLNYWRERV